jgi:hypothetical protein
MLYSIKQLVIKNGSQIFIPLGKPATKWYDVIGKTITPWKRIVRIYNTYHLMDGLFEEDEDLNLSYTNCIDHIEGFKAQLEATKVLEVIQMKMFDYTNKDDMITKFYEL